MIQIHNKTIIWAITSGSINFFMPKEASVEIHSVHVVYLSCWCTLSSFFCSELFLIFCSKNFKFLTIEIDGIISK